MRRIADRYPTARDPHWPTASRVAAKLLVQSTALPPEAISGALGLAPTRFFPAASHLPPGEAHLEFRRTTHTWSLSSEDAVASLDLRDHLDWLLDRIEPRRDRIEDLRRDGATQAGIMASYWLTALGGPALWPVHMRRIADLDLELAFHLAHDP